MRGPMKLNAAPNNIHLILLLLIEIFFIVTSSRSKIDPGFPKLNQEKIQQNAGENVYSREYNVFLKSQGET
jgi:hypothetical protein